MAKNEKVETVENVVAPTVEVEIDPIDKAKDFWAKFSKPIMVIGTAIILLGGGWLAYKNFVKIPNEQKAAEAIFPAEKLFDKMTQSGFNKDSINMVLNGSTGSFSGVLSVISKFGGTAAGNRAHYIAGACYLHGKDFNNAIKHLKDFSTSATQVQTAAYLMLGDAYSEIKDKSSDAFDYYSKAATVNTKDEFMTAESLYKAALYAETVGKTKEAIANFQKIKSDYPKSSRNNDVDKYLARLGIVN
jgi:tetratricopeptide (TPR) repeat protein